MTIAIDTDKAVQALTGVGFKKEQARVLIDQLLPIGDGLVTKDYMSSEIALIKAEIQRLETLIETKITELNVRFESLEARFESLEARMVARFYGGQIASVVAVVGALKLFGVF